MLSRKVLETAERYVFQGLPGRSIAVSVVVLDGLLGSQTGNFTVIEWKSDFSSQVTAVSYVKSILKPTIALSPPKQIPPFPSTRKQPQSPRKQPPSPTKLLHQRSPEKQRNFAQEGVLIDTSDGTDGATPSGLLLPDPFGGRSPRRDVAAKSTFSPQVQSVVAVRTEEEQQEAARERERREKDHARKDARRKSLGASSK